MAHCKRTAFSCLMLDWQDARHAHCGCRCTRCVDAHRDALTWHRFTTTWKQLGDVIDAIGPTRTPPRADLAQQQGGFERPPDGMEATECPRCHSPASSGFGLMGGGYGPYLFCDGNCGWYYKEQEGELEPRVLPDSVYSVIIRYVPIYEGGPKHEVIPICDRCGEERPQTYDNAAEPFGPSLTSSLPKEFVGWMIGHRKACKGKG